MKDRLRDIIIYKTRGKQKEFAELLGWSPAYLHNLLKGTSIGLQPVITLLRAIPEINARWFLLGEGEMFTGDKYDGLRQQSLAHIKDVLDLERFLPVMTPEELEEYERMVTTSASPHFGSETRLRWMSLAAERQMGIDVRVKEAMIKSDELCRQETASKS